MSARREQHAAERIYRARTSGCWQTGVWIDPPGWPNVSVEQLVAVDIDRQLLQAIDSRLRATLNAPVSAPAIRKDRYGSLPCRFDADAEAPPSIYRPRSLRA